MRVLIVSLPVFVVNSRVFEYLLDVVVANSQVFEIKLRVCKINSQIQVQIPRIRDKFARIGV